MPHNRSLAFQDRVVIVTGGSSGIGRATALLFAEKGARVLVTGRRAGPLAETVAERVGMESIVADVTSEEDTARVVEKAVELWGGVDVLVNNAGAFAVRPLERATPQLVKQIFETNVVGATLMARAVLPHITSRRGTIVNVSSTFGHKPAAMIGHYAASKAALEQLTRCWALELAPNGVRVNAIAPGPTETPILERSGLSREAIESLQREEAEKLPLGRRGAPEEVARWIVAIADPSASWITGQVLAVDGGLGLT